MQSILITAFVSGLLICQIPGRLTEGIVCIIRDGIICGLMLAFTWDSLVMGNFGDMIDYITTAGNSRTSPCGEICSFAASSMLVWSCTAMAVIGWRLYRDSIIDQLLRPSYTPLNVAASAAAVKSTGAKLKSYKGTTLTYASNLEMTNYIDPDVLREWFPYTKIIFDSALRIENIHGFQLDNSRGQVEHLIMLIFNEGRFNDDTDAPSRIHQRMFQNYVKWCTRMEIEPNLLGITGEPSDLIEDMLLYLHIWGEAANLRHLPECLCFLFHKTMDIQKEHRNDRHLQNESDVYAGFYLDTVIRPLYEVVAAALAKNEFHKDHIDHKIYDDFNEFFWNPECLQYNLLDCHDGEVSALALAMQAAPKSYMEKRSWFHPLYSMNRLFEWHTLSFTILATIAFSTLLQWTWIFTLKVGSVIFLQISVFGILWTCLEVWTLFPSVDISVPSLCGYLIRILAGYLVLSYQTIYFHWAFVDNEDTSLKSIALFNEGNDLFWWWQYIWLSLMACSLYSVQALLAFFPSVVSSILLSKNELVQALLSIVYPNSQLYVGKDTSLPAGHVWISVVYWVSLLSFKLWFGYYFVVGPVATPTLELYDDFMNFHRPSFLKTSVLMFFWWLPHFLVYIIDLSIWYAVWSSMAGGIVAMYDRLGAVRDTDTFRSQFIRAPILFYDRCMPSVTQETASANGGLKKNSKSTDSLTSFMLDASTESSRQKTEVVQAPATEADKTRSQTSAVKQPILDRAALKNRQWKVFSHVWNEIILKLRERDLISDKERDFLVFTNFENLPKPTYLPLYQTVGSVYNAAFAYRTAHEAVDAATDNQLKMKLSEEFILSMDPSAVEAANEAWSLFCLLMDYMLGPQHAKDVRYLFGIITDWSNDKPTYLFGRISGSVMPTIVTRAGKIASILKNGIAQRKKTPVEIPDPATLAAANAQTMGNNSNYAVSSSTSPTSTSPVVIPTNGDPSYGTENTSNNLKRSLSSGYLQNLEKQKKYHNQQFARGVEIHDKMRDHIRDELKGMLLALVTVLQSNNSDEVNNIKMVRATLLSESRGFWMNDAYASQRINVLAEYPHVLPMVSKLEGLLNLQVTDVEIKSLEANRRLNFFLNSMYMTIPQVLETRFSREYTVVTPYYEEDILLTEKDLKAENSDRISVILYLQTLYRDEWENFLKRLGITEESEIWSAKYLQDTRIWASCRAQTLYRTVEGMMYNEQAIRLLAELEQSKKRGLAVSPKLSADYYLDGYGPRYTNEEIEILCKTKFNYVVACQVYGEFKKSQDPKAKDVEFLMEKFPNIRVAYIDRHRVSADQSDFYSVLIKYEPSHAAASSCAAAASFSAQGQTQPEIDIAQCSSVANDAEMKLEHADDAHCKGGKIREVYRVKLPGNPVLGEGKPENQNHAIIFTRGRYLQAIDMNQDGYFEEALKMRNVLQEFAPLEVNKNPHILQQQLHQHQTVIVGFREHIFTGSVSSVANYMALQELSFVTLGQRVLNRPLKIRQHYGHPDFFDKLFVVTEGGMSKASKGINLSEDVFAGFNATIRGYLVQFVEFVQCGKGRDVGLQQTYNFEAKLSQGNAEQSISRDVSRIGNRLDFFRLLSFYYGGIGHYLSNTLVMMTLVIVIYTMLGFAIYNEEGVNGRPMHPEGVFQILLAGMGILQTLPLFVTLTVEKGFFKACVDIFWMIVSGGPLYFIFHIQTKCYYFSQTLLAGGAKYRPTGRGFVTRHSPFKENYRYFATSHIYLGFELVVALLLFACFTKSKQYFGLTWSLWLGTIAFILGPFWFNPASFDWPRISEDYVGWKNWMWGQGGTFEQSWEVWWKEENAFYKGLSTTWKILLFIQKVVVWFVIANGIFGGFDSQWKEEGRFVMVLLVLAALIFGPSKLLERIYRARNVSYFFRRSISLVWMTVCGIWLMALLVQHPRHLLSLVAMYYLGGAFCFLGLLLGYAESETLLWFYFLHDFIVGHFLFALLAVFSFASIHQLQTWLLYHNALSQKVEMDNILQRVRRIHERTSQLSPVQASIVPTAVATTAPTPSLTVSPSSFESGVVHDMAALRERVVQQEQLLRQLQKVAASAGLLPPETSPNPSNSSGAASNPSNAAVGTSESGQAGLSLSAAAVLAASPETQLGANSPSVDNRNFGFSQPRHVPR